MKSLLLFVSLLLANCLCAVEFSDRARNFSIELLYHTQAQTNGHVVISPFGVWTLMTGVALGARGNSYKQLSGAFRLPKSKKYLIDAYKKLTGSVIDPTTKGVSVTSRNFMFMDSNFSIKPEFQREITSEFGAKIKKLDFKDAMSASRIANDYIQNAGGNVTNVLTSNDFTESRMILTNVITFKGVWATRFNKTDTAVEPFYNEKKEVVGNVNMMYQKAQVPLSLIQSLKSFVLELPYGTDGKYSMIIILPHPKIKAADVYKNLEYIDLKEITNKLQKDVDELGLEEVDVKIPRFKISTNVVLNKPLNDMGVYDIFEPGVARFENIASEPIFVSAIVHKADIEVTETGTVATASTSAIFADRISSPVFTANRPFIYFIIEKSTTSIIFGGIYSKPTVY